MQVEKLERKQTINKLQNKPQIYNHRNHSQKNYQIPPRSNPNVHHTSMFTKPIALIGMMGAGKTSFGKKIAKKIEAQFFDSDAQIKLKTGYTPKEIFNYFGQDMFQDTELSIIEDLVQHKHAIIATGDGLIDNKKAWEYLKKNAITIWLNIDLRLISARLKPNEDRPYLDAKQDESILNFITALYKKRVKKYKEAHLTIHRPILNKKAFQSKLNNIILRLQAAENAKDMKRNINGIVQNNEIEINNKLIKKTVTQEKSQNQFEHDVPKNDSENTKKNINNTPHSNQLNNTPNRYKKFFFKKRGNKSKNTSMTNSSKDIA